MSTHELLEKGNANSGPSNIVLENMDIEKLTSLLCNRNLLLYFWTTIIYLLDIRCDTYYKTNLNSNHGRFRKKRIRSNAQNFVHYLKGI